MKRVTKTERLAALDAEFDSPLNLATGAMKFSEYQQRRDALEAEAEAEPPASAPVQPPRPAELGVTWRSLEFALVELAAALRQRERETERRHVQRIEALEQRIEVLGSRLASAETKTAAVAMLLAGRGQSSEKISELESLLGRVTALEQKP